MKQTLKSENGSSVLASVIIVLIILGVLAVIFLGYSNKDKTWSLGQAQANAKQIEDNLTSDKRGTIPPPSTNGDKGAAQGEATNSQGTASTTVNVNVTGNIGSNNNGVDDAAAAQSAKKAAEEKDAPKEDILDRKYDPNSPNPMYSWKESDKVNAPVRYHQEVLNYLKAQETKIKTTRNSIGVTARTWKTKLDDAKKKVAGDEAVLRKAAKLYREADANDDWPVSYAYRTYEKDAFKLKLQDLSNALKKDKNELRNIQNGYDMLSNSLRSHDKQLEMLSNEISHFTNNLELIRSGKLTTQTLEKIKELETNFAESEQALDVIMQEAEKTIFKESTQESAEADMNLESILDMYAPVD